MAFCQSLSVQRRWVTGWTMDGAAIITQGQAIFNALAPVAVVAIGIGLGLKVLSRVKGLFK